MPGLSGAAVLLAIVLGIYIVGLWAKENRELAALADIQEQDDLDTETPAPEKEEEMETDTEAERKEEEEEETEEVQEPEEVVPESFSEEELAALIEDKSGKYIGNAYTNENDGEIKKTACYDDFDGDGRYELFAYVADEWGEVYEEMRQLSEMGINRKWRQDENKQMCEMYAGTKRRIYLLYGLWL